MITLQIDMKSVESFIVTLHAHVTTLVKVFRYFAQNAISEVHTFIYESISLSNLFEREKRRQGQERREERRREKKQSEQFIDENK